jgi:hypothetical protein
MVLSNSDLAAWWTLDADAFQATIRVDPFLDFGLPEYIGACVDRIPEEAQYRVMRGA